MTDEIRVHCYVGPGCYPIKLHEEREVMRTAGWKMHVHPYHCCWIVRTAIVGMNGAGGFWVEQSWYWSTGGKHHTTPASLSYADSCRLLERMLFWPLCLPESYGDLSARGSL